MRIIALIVLSLIVFACDKSDDPAAGRLTRTEARSYTGYIMHTDYEYDGQGRMIRIRQRKDDEAPVEIVAITYEGNDAVLLSHPDFDPSYIQTTKVRLTLNGDGLPQKRIEYTHRVSKITGIQPPESFVYDTLLFEYDASGFLANTRKSRYDSIWIDPTHNRVSRVKSDATYTVESGNLTAFDEFAEHPILIRNGGTTTLAGGSTEYHFIFNYTKSYPNKTDFRNAAILNEYKQHHEAVLNRNYKYMPDQVILNTIHRDLNDSVVFALESTYAMERAYTGEGLLSSVKIPGGVQYPEINYFYR